MLKLELKMMYILNEENIDLKEEVNQLKALNSDERAMSISEENHKLKRRNGELII